MTVPLLAIFLHKKVGECFFTGPLDRDPLQLRLLVGSRAGVTTSYVLHWYLSVHVVLNLLDARISVVYRLLLFTCDLEPVGHFKDVALFQVLVVAVTLITVDVYLRRIANFSEFPPEYILLR